MEPKKKQRAAVAKSLLARFDCVVLAFEMVVPLESFKATKLFELFGRTDVKDGDRWGATIPPGSKAIGYHIHFKCWVEDDEVHLVIEYANKSTITAKGPPVAESFMQWIGSLYDKDCVDSYVTARFRRSPDKWRSSFTLPVKVLMAGREIQVDGVSVVLPENDFGAVRGFVGQDRALVMATVAANRAVRFSSFDLGQEVADLSGASEMFLERKL